MIIVLTGLPGSGKSSSGEHLANKLNYHFIDLDKYIEIITTKTITELFSEQGEQYFRQQEQLILVNIFSTYQYKNMVLSLGGGTFTFENNIALCKNCGYVIWLNTCLSIIYQRILKDIDTRPIFHSNINLQEQLKNLYEIRKNYYKQAHKEIKIQESMSLNDISHLIIENLNN